jgi:hypothetical protein
MMERSELVVEHSFRRRLDDTIGLGLLVLASALSFTGLVDLARFMHPVRFALLVATAICAYQVITKTFARFVFGEAGIESRAFLRKAKRWRYQQLIEVRESAAAPVRSSGRRQTLRLRFDDGSTLKVDGRMRHASAVLTFLRRREPQLNVIRT